jgi:hypothetical protein
MAHFINVLSPRQTTFVEVAKSRAGSFATPQDSFVP